MENKEETLSPVVKYMKEFLASDKCKLMECCYASIRDSFRSRSHREQIEELKNSEFDCMFPLVSCIVLTANKIECDSLNYILSQQEKASIYRRKHPLPIFQADDFGAPEAFICKLHSFYILHLRAYETGSNTPGGSSDLVRYISRHPYLRPSSIISFGICYGRDPEKQAIGNVIIPKKLYPWSIGQKISDRSFKVKHDDFNLSLEQVFSKSGIYSSLRTFCNDIDGRSVIGSLKLCSPRQGESSTTQDFTVWVSQGNMSTGEAVVSSSEVKKLIQESTHNEEELGGEMEGYGLAKECIFYAKIPCLIIKAICDWGEEKNIDQVLQKNNISAPPCLKDKLQAYAAFCAGIVLIQLLSHEKELLLRLGLLRQMDDSTRADVVNKYNYASKETILKHIKKFYEVNSNNAQKIFDLLENYNIIVCSPKGIKYRVNAEL